MCPHYNKGTRALLSVSTLEEVTKGRTYRHTCMVLRSSHNFLNFSLYIVFLPNLTEDGAFPFDDP